MQQDWKQLLISEEQILEQVQPPGEVSYETAKINAEPQRWHVAACDTMHSILWGINRREMKPVFSAVDLQTGKLYCSCMIKIRPCKHSLGLFILATRDQRIVVERKVAPPAIKALKLKV